MHVSVVICSHTSDRYESLISAIESVLSQSYEDRSVVVIVDGNPTLKSQLDGAVGSNDDVLVHLQEENSGLLASRNRGASLADGDIVAFLDDDAVAHTDWLAELIDCYTGATAEPSATDGIPSEWEYPLAVGGRMCPRWVAGKPEWLPSEFYWLIGVTHRGFPEGPGDVRNTPGSNLSFRKPVFEALGGFDTEIGGRTGDKQLQGGETELCVRLRNAFHTGVYYTPDARVDHRIFAYRTSPWWLVKRAFWQGYSKRGMAVLGPDDRSGTAEEGAFLKQLCTQFVPSRLRTLVRSPSVTALAQLCLLCLLTIAVGSGYAYGVFAWRSS